MNEQFDTDFDRRMKQELDRTIKRKMGMATWRQIMGQGQKEKLGRERMIGQCSRRSILKLVYRGAPLRMLREGTAR